MDRLARALADIARDQGTQARPQASIPPPPSRLTVPYGKS